MKLYFRLDLALPFYPLVAMKALQSHDSEKITEKRTSLTFKLFRQSSVHSFISWEINLELKINNKGTCMQELRLEKR